MKLKVYYLFIDVVSYASKYQLCKYVLPIEC